MDVSIELDLDPFVSFPVATPCQFLQLSPELCKTLGVALKLQFFFPSVEGVTKELLAG